LRRLTRLLRLETYEAGAFDERGGSLAGDQ
jgi:hypothetical protein